MQDATSLFEALADDTRRQVLELLSGGERTAGEVASHFPIARPSVSRHLRVLRDAGLITWRAEAQRRVYRIEAERLTVVADWLEGIRGRWSQRLDALERHLDETRKD
ncbi:MAG: metalloregulator ArsR/SmtB family transcription factor [Chloroflexota bacterium]|nr:metalloregulator ArsR/SmtB family transcription factor [Chloroflexota bacterium]